MTAFIQRGVFNMRMGAPGVIGEWGMPSEGGIGVCGPWRARNTQDCMPDWKGAKHNTAQINEFAISVGRRGVIAIDGHQGRRTVRQNFRVFPGHIPMPRGVNAERIYQNVIMRPGTAVHARARLPA